MKHCTTNLIHQKTSQNSQREVKRSKRRRKKGERFERKVNTSLTRFVELINFKLFSNIFFNSFKFPLVVISNKSFILIIFYCLFSLASFNKIKKSSLYTEFLVD